MRLAFAVFALALFAAPLAAQAQSAPSAPAAAPTTPSDAVVTGWARDWLRSMQTGTIDRTQLTDEMNAALTPDTVRSVQAQLASLGQPIAVTLQRKATANGYIGYYFALRFDSGIWIEHLVLDANNKIAALRFTPGP